MKKFLFAIGLILLLLIIGYILITSTSKESERHPIVTLNVFGTEYQPNSFGTVFVSLLESGHPIENASCYVDIYYPNKTKWIDYALMVSHENGLFYYDIYTPDIEGVYMVNVLCQYYTTLSIHPITVRSILDGFENGSVYLTQTWDGVYYTITEEPEYLDVRFITDPVTIPPNATSLDLVIVARTSSHEKFYFDIWNDETKQWVRLPNYLTYSDGNFIVISNNIPKDWWSVIIRNDGTIMFRIKNTQVAGSVREPVDIDYIAFVFSYQASEFLENLRGSGELHVQHFNVTVNATINVTVTLPAEWEINVFGTEYSPGDEGRIFLQLLRDGEPVNNSLCLVDIYWPNKTVFIREAPMFYLEGSKGLYYFDFLAPEQEGIYMLTVQCFYIVEKTFDYADDVTITTGTHIWGSYQDTWQDDGRYYIVREAGLTSYGIDVRFYFYNISVPENYTGMTIYWSGKWTSDEEELTVQAWDWCNDVWFDAFDNKVSIYTPTVSNFLSVDKYNVSCLVSPTGTVIVRFKDTNPTEKVKRGYFYTDYIDVQMNYLKMAQIEAIRGGGEIHVAYEKIEPAENPKIIVIS